MAFKSKFFQQNMQQSSVGASGLKPATAKEPTSMYKWQRDITAKKQTSASSTNAANTTTPQVTMPKSTTRTTTQITTPKRVYGGNYTSPERARSNYVARSGVRQSSSSSTLALDYLRQNGMSTDLAGMSAQQVRDKIASTKDDDQREQMRTYAQWLEDQGDKATISSANDSIGAGTQKTAKAAPVQNWSNPTQAMKVQNLQHQQTVLGSESKTLNQKGDSIREMETRLKKISDAYNAHPTKLLSDRYDALYKSYQQTVKDAQAGQKSYQSTLTGYKKDSRDYAQEYDDSARYQGMDYTAMKNLVDRLGTEASMAQDDKTRERFTTERNRALKYQLTLGSSTENKQAEDALKAERKKTLEELTSISAASTKTAANQTIKSAAAAQAKLDRINADLRLVQQGREQSQNKENSQKFINYAAGDKTEKLPDVKASKSYINYLINGKKAIKPSPELQAEANKIEKSIALLPENERKAMQYYINQGDVENAAKFYTTIKDEAERLYSTSEAESAYKWAGKSFPNAVAATVGSGIIGAVGTQSGWLDNLISAAKNSIVDSFGVGNYRFSDTNGDAYLGSRVSGAMQEGVQTYNNRTLGEGSAAAGTANTLAGATTSAIENVVQFALFGEYMLPVMALGAAGQSSYETLRSGGSEEDAAVTSAVDGAVEYLTEVIPFQKLLDRLDLIGKGGGTMSVADIAKMVRSQGLEEANEEVVGNIAENLFDMAYHKDQSDFWKYVSQLKDQGYSEDAAEKEAYGKYFIGDSLEAGISAYISSAMMFGGSFVNAKVQTDKDTRILGQTVKGMAGSNGISLDNELRKGLLLNDDTAATLSKEHANGGDISTKDAAVLAQKNSDALLELIQKAQDSGSEEAKGAVLRLMANTRTGNMLGVQSEDVAYLQQVLSMSPETSTSTDTNSEKKTTTVLDRATTAFTDLGMKLSVAQKKADVVNRLVSGADVTDSEINSLNPTNSKFRQLFTDLTGVQFPERASIETYRNLYRSASSVDAQVAQTTDTMNTPAVDSVAANDAITQILSGNVPAAEVSSTVQSVLDGTYTQKKADAEQQYVQQRSQSPEVQEQAAKVYATVNGDLDENGNRLATFKEFSNQYRLSVNPTATNTETAVQYQNYLEDNRTTRFNGQRMNYRSFSNLLRTAPGGNALTDTEIRTLFDGAGKGDTDLADSIRSTAKKAAVQERTAKLDAVVTRMKSLLSGTGVKDIVIDTEGWAAPENNETARHNGYIENGVVHLNGNLITTESAIYYTLGHELTHAAYDAKGKAILDNIISAFQELQKKGALTGTLSTRVQNLDDTIRKTKELYTANDTSRTYTEDDIRQEVAADLMSEVFGSKELMDRLAGVKPSILDRARDIVTQMLSKITGDTSGETVQILKHLSDNFADALKGFDTYHTGETVVDEKGEPVGVSDENGDTKLSLSTYEQSGRDLIRKWVAVEVEDNQLTQQDADDITDSLESIYETCRNYKNEFASFSAWSDAKVVSGEDGKPAFSVVKANGEYVMNLDFSTVCKKRRTLDAVLNKLVESGLADSFEFGQEDIVDINNIIKQNGFEIACALCFVDAKRFRWAGDVDTFVTPYNELVRSLIPEGKNYKIDIFNFGGDTTVSKETGKTLDTIPDSELDFTKIDQAIKDDNDKTRIGKIARLLRDDPKQRCLLLRGDLLSSGGTGAMVKNNPVLFETFNGLKGAGAAKASFADVQYQNEMIGQNEKSFDSEKAYSVGGVRIQSFSDYIPNMVFDYVQMLGDMSAKKLPAHAYTKEFLFAAQFGLTGIKINLSLIPKVDTEHTDAPAGLDADGNYLWADESFDFDLAVKIQNAEGYSKNCGSIAVGASYEHIMKMMEDPNIRMIIPYHKSGINPIVAEMNNIDRFEDFTNYQSTRYADSGKKLNKTDIKNDFLYNDYLHKNGDPRATAEQYVRWCEDKNYIPKFDQMKLRDGRVVSLAYLYKDGVAVEKNGKKVVNPNYYKVLEDFSVYDAVTDEYTPQGAVQMKFPDANSAFGSMKNLIRQGLQENQDLEERRSEKVDGMVEQIKEVLHPVKRQSITAQQDEEYQKAVDSGDMETAQKLADDAAKQSGFGVVAYHGTPTYGFNSFDPDRIGKNSGVGRGAFYFTSNQGRAESYATPSKTATASNMLANMNKVFQQYNSPELRKITGADDDAEGIEWDLDAISDYVHDRDYIDFNYDPDEYDSNSQYRKAEREAEDAGFKKYLTEQAEDLAKQSESIPSLKGFADDIRKAVEVPEAKSGVYKVYLYDAGKTKTYTADENTYNDVAWKAASESKDLAEIHLNNGDTVYFTSNPANIKSADAVVRDDAGNVIPLSQRFNRTKNDIRYSITKSSDGKELTQEQQDYFKDSRVRDSSGNLLKVYHGTQENFTVFDRDKIGSHGRFEGAGFNFTPSQDRASSYSNGQNVLEGYLNITHPLSSETKTILVSKLAALIRDADPTGDNIISNYAQNTADYGKQSFINRESLTTARQIWNNSDNDVDIYSELSSGDPDASALISQFEKLGYDGVIHYNDDGSIKTAVAFSSEQFKNANNQNPTTDKDIRFSIEEEMDSAYDDAGKVIPLSERFNANKTDPRYSTDTDGNELSEQTSEYFKDSKARDKKGRLMVLYHGTEKTWTEYDLDKSDDQNSIFLTDNRDVARSYTTKDRTINPYQLVDVENAPLDQVAAKFREIYPEANLSEITKEEVTKARAQFKSGLVVALQSAEELKKALIAGHYEDTFGARDFLNDLRRYYESKNLAQRALRAQIMADDVGKWGKDSFEAASSAVEQAKSVLGAIRDSASTLAATADGTTSAYRQDDHFRPILREDEIRRWTGIRQAGGVVPLYANITHPLEVDAGGVSWNRIPVPPVMQDAIYSDTVTTRGLSAFARDNGYDGVIIRNVRDNGGTTATGNKKSTVMIAFDSSQIKSVLNEAPTANKDIRYSLTDNTLPSDEDIKNGSATFLGMQIKYEPNMHAEADSWGSYMRVSDKFFSLDDSTKRQILNHEVAHNVADDIMAKDWDGAAKDGLFITHKIAPEGSKRAGQDYWEGMYGDINNSLSETLATAAATYFTNPDSLKARSQAAYDYIDNFVKSTGSQMGPRYSLTEVSPVQPSENAEWSRGLTEQQISDLGYKLFGDVSQEEIDAMTPEEKEIYRKGHETQVKSTVSSYEKIFDGLKRQSPDNWQNLRVLDASSGLGYGTQAGRNAGFNVTDIEPYPSTTAYAEGKPDYTDYTKLAEQVRSGEVKPFDVIISNAVLNVLPQDTVDNLVSAMGELLAPGGTMYINVRDRSFLKDVLVSPKNRLLNYNGDIQTTTTTGGKTQAVLPTGLPAYDAYVAQTKTVQRGYTYNELASYLKDALGDGYTVSRASFLGSAAAVVQKGQAALHTGQTPGALSTTNTPDVKRFSITPEFEQWYKDHYDTESVTDSQLERRLQHQDEKIQNQKESEQAKLSMQNKAWEMYDQRTKRQQAQAAAESKRAALDQAQKEKVQALSDLKEYLDAKAAVQYDADRMHEGRVKGQAIARLTQHEKDRVDQLKAHEQERVRLADRRARAVLQDQNRVNTIRQREAVVNGPVDTIRNSPERMAQVNFVQKEADRLRTLGRSAYATFWNNAQAIDDFAKKQDDGMAGILVNIVRGVNSTVDQIYTKGLVDRAGNQIGSSMKDTFLCMDGKNVDENKQALLQDYMLHQHNIDRMGLVQKALDRVTQFESEHPEVAALDSKGLRLTIVEDTTNAVQAKKDFQAKAIQYARLLRTAAEVQNKPIFADKNGVAVTADTSRQIVAQYVKDNPWLAEKSKGIHEWWSQFMQTWAVGDSVTEDMYDMLERVYPNYAPTYRVQGKGVGTANFVGANGATPGQAIKKAKGGLSEVVNIEDSYANLVQKTIKLARVNELYKSIVDSAMRDADGKFSTMAVYDWENSGVSKQEVFGEDADEIEDNAIQSGLAQDRNGYTVSAWFNGKLERAYISKDLFNSLKATTTSEANGFTKLGAKITGPMKQAITGINPNFALRNVSRDMPTAIINSISGLAFPKYWAQAAKEIATNSENWQHFQTLGGAQANYYNNENGFAKALSKNDNVKSKTLKAVGWFNEVTESQTRFAEYLATIDRLGGDTYENRLKGIKNAAEVTVDFGRHGTVGKAINAWVPYWNPSMQGIDKVIRSVVQTKDGRVLFSKALSTLGRAAVTNILPEILMYAILKKDPDKYAEWAQLSDRTKDTYYCIPCGDHKFLKIPKNREWGSILGTPLMRILEGENGRADPFANYVEDALIPNFLPNQIIGLEDGRVTSDIIGLSQGLELNSNKDFAGRTIVPYAYQQGSLSQQYDADTSWYAKKLGDALDLSPMQIDYVMKSYFGDFADMAQKATSDATWGGDEPAVKEISNGVLSVITKPWVADSRYSNQNVSDYYEMIDNLGRVVQDKRNQMGTDAAQKTTEYKTEKALEKLYGSQITDLNKQARNMPDGEEKDAIKQQIVDLSQNALKYYDDCMSGDIKEPLLDATYAEFPSGVSSELIRMDSYSEEYKFKPTGTPSAKYTDPDNKKREYVLDDDEKTQFKSIYNDQYSEAMTRLISTSRYRNAKDEKKAQMLEDLRDDVLDDTKTEFFKWLRKQGIRSTEKK